MSADPKDSKDPNALAAEAAAAGQQAQTPEARARALEGEVKLLQARKSSVDPAALAQLTQENQRLAQRLEKLTAALVFLSRESLRPRGPDEAKYQAESLRKSAVEYCQKQKIEPSLWKSIES